MDVGDQANCWQQTPGSRRCRDQGHHVPAMWFLSRTVSSTEHNAKQRQTWLRMITFSSPLRFSFPTQVVPGHPGNRLEGRGSSLRLSFSFVPQLNSLNSFPPLPPNKKKGLTDNPLPHPAFRYGSRFLQTAFRASDFDVESLRDSQLPDRKGLARRKL